HPAFGAPLVGPDCIITSNAESVIADIGHPLADPARVRTRWPEHLSPGGEPVDLSHAPPPRSGHSRRAFLADFPGRNAFVSIANPVTGLRARIEWEAADFPYAWYWLEAGGRGGFPWYGDAYVLGIEPCTSYPTGGIGAIRALSGTQVVIPAGAEVTRSVAVSFGALA
ncbi:MAG TPA: hypothetical protein VFS93_05430, partial [Terrimesophilobacter sp.]|nr:hypothetical protein [Terrimesophilobacter sp.]